MAAIKEKRCYTAQEIQEILNISRPSVYNLIKKGEFHSVFVGGKHLISKKSFDAWLNGCEVGLEGDGSAGDNEKEKPGRTGLQQEQKQQGTKMSISSGSNIINDGAKQEAVKYQELQDMLLQNLIKTYMMIGATGHMK